MNALWPYFTLAAVPIAQWRSSSYLNRFIGLLRDWRRQSVLLAYSEWLGAALVTVVYTIAPFTNNNSVTGILLIACAAFWLLLTVSDDQAVNWQTGDGLWNQTGLTTPIHVLVGLYWAIASLATALSPVRKAAIEGWSKLTLYLILFALLARLLRSPKIRNWIIGVYLHLSLIVSMEGWRQWKAGVAPLATWVDTESGLSKTTRVYSYLGNPNLLAGYLLPAVVFGVAAIFMWQGRIRKGLAAVITAMNLTCLILTFSRGGWIGLVASGLTLAVLLAVWYREAFPPAWQKWALPVVSGGLGLIILVAIAASSTLRERVFSMFSGRGDSSNNFRINVWIAVLDMIKARPVLGIGPGNDAFNAIYPAYQKTRFTALSAYSILLEVLVETGVIGLISFLWLIAMTFYQGWTHLKRLQTVRSRQAFWLIAAIATMTGMIAHALFDTVWYRPQVNTLWWLMLAMVASYYPRQEETEELPLNFTTTGNASNE